MRVLLHVERARRAWPHLVRRAANGGPPFTYAEIGRLVDCHARSAGPFLKVVQLGCAEAGFPALQALAVYKATGLPGSGYDGSARTPDAHRRELERVRAARWPLEPPF